ncbi:MAG: TRAP transporter permease [Actinomycetota bacterium]
MNKNVVGGLDPDLESSSAEVTAGDGAALPHEDDESDVVKELDAESEAAVRKLEGTLLGKVVYGIAVAIAVFHLYVNNFSLMSELWRNAIHMGSLGLLGFLVYPGWKKGARRFGLALDIGLGLLIFGCAAYLILMEDALRERNEVPITSDLIFAAIAVVLVLELARRTAGLVIPLLAVFFLTYVVWWGSLIDGMFFFRGMRVQRVLYRMFFTDEGLFGITASISSTFVFMFILFASFLLNSGAGDFIINLSAKMTHRVKGGPGLVAVVGSGLMGTISGSAVANTVSTGSITIPMMKRAGFRPTFAGGVETAASTGGQLMPPIMGAGAFIMAQWTGLPYTTIIGVALLPALLYFATVGFFVYQEANRHDIQPTNETSDESIGRILRGGVHFLIPIGVLVGMLIYGYTPTYSAGFAIIAVVLSSWLSRDHKMGPRDVLDSLAQGSRNMVTTGIMLIAAGIIVGAINLSGVSITFSQLIVDLSGGVLIYAIVLIAIASLFLGMGLPVTAAYIMLAVLAAPALEGMGVSLLAAHMIIFWLSQDSNVTPPVCLAAYAASGIAGASPMATGVSSWKIAKGLYIMPLLFAYSWLIDGSVVQQLQVFAFGLFGLYAFSAVFTGYLFDHLSMLGRILLLPLVGLLLWPSLGANLVGLVLFVGLFILQNRRRIAPEVSAEHLVPA